MRIRLYREGVETFDGRLIESSWWESDQEAWPVKYQVLEPGVHYGASLKVIGQLTKLRRDGLGWVTGELKLFEPKDLSGRTSGAEFDAMETTIDKPGACRNARFRAITLTDAPNWDGMEITGLEED